MNSQGMEWPSVFYSRSIALKSQIINKNNITSQLFRYMLLNNSTQWDWGGQSKSFRQIWEI